MGQERQPEYSMFDVTMGSYDEAEIDELVGLFILSNLTKKLGKDNVHGSLQRWQLDSFEERYRETGRQSEKIIK